MVDAVSKIDENGDLEHQHNVVKDTAGIVFVGELPLLHQRGVVLWIFLEGGADTTLSAMETIFVAMMSFPEAQSKAQEELDRVLQGRFPDYDDLKDLPYIAALVKEILRWVDIRHERCLWPVNLFLDGEL